MELIPGSASACDIQEVRLDDHNNPFLPCSLWIIYLILTRMRLGKTSFHTLLMGELTEQGKVRQRSTTERISINTGIKIRSSWLPVLCLDHCPLISPRPPIPFQHYKAHKVDFFSPCSNSRSSSDHLCLQTKLVSASEKPTSGIQYSWIS